MNPKREIMKADYTLIAKVLSEEASTQEQERFEQWLNESTHNQSEFTHIRHIFEQADAQIKMDLFSKKEGWKEVHQRISPQKSITRTIKYSWRSIASIAATILLVVSLSVIYYFNNQEEYHLRSVQSQTASIIPSVSLPDGTNVSLNSSSTLKYPEEFSRDTREVFVEGEAFFDVEPDKNKPFIIRAGNSLIRVLGTSFNVRAIPGQDTVEVIVRTGRVELISEAGTEKEKLVTLNKGEVGTYSAKSKRVQKRQNKNINYLSWKTHRLIFKETPLTEVVKHIEAVYHVDLSIADDHIKTKKLTAQFDQQPLSFVLKVISMTFPDVKVTYDDEIYRLVKK
ncbi:DUF4974 domain-containing protein [Puteibacter caeruleilacunae]|nr:DUF4974 domain-containing protein [Puteibacter caeruleilacunae]